MIKLKLLVLEYKEASVQLTPYQFEKLFLTHCKNIESIDQCVYKGMRDHVTLNNLSLFKPSLTPTTRQSA